VNGREHSVGQEFDEKFLHESRMLFLDAGNQTEVSTLSEAEEPPGEGS
jgi:hypothetical protein